jgi:hypothetical protein
MPFALVMMFSSQAPTPESIALIICDDLSFGNASLDVPRMPAHDCARKLGNPREQDHLRRQRSAESSLVIK